MPNPFRGLTPFEAKDRRVFFERDADVEAIVGHLWSARVCLLFAGSGVGKTSFLQAKLVPHLKSLLGNKSVFSPDKWAQTNPVAALKNLQFDKPALLDQLESSKTEADADPEMEDDQKTQVLILDQFEEVFQYFPNASLLNKLGKELANLVNPKSRGKTSESDGGSTAYQALKIHDTRIIISIREEFLAELSMFDSFLPNLLSNYYRLERLTTRQAQSVIEKTAATEGVFIDLTKISTVLDDLRTVKETRRRGIFIDPPYLQIVCKQLWEDEQPTRERLFLSSYKTGVAEETLRDYCDHHLNGLTWPEKIVTNKAIGFITIGKYQAKRSVRLREIQDRIGRKPAARLAASLDKLSAEGVKIFRRWEEQPAIPESSDGKVEAERPEVYALYHDMYAPMLWDWRERQERSERRRTTLVSAVALALLFFFVLWPFWKYLNVRSALDDPRYGDAAQFANVLEFRNALAQTIVGKPLADSIWRKYTDRLTSLAALKLDTDGAFLYRLAGAAASGTDPSDPDQSGMIASKKFLLGTFFSEPDAQIVDATLDGNKIVAVTRVGRLIHWSLNDPGNDLSGRPIKIDYGQTSPSALAGPGTPPPSPQSARGFSAPLAVSPPMTGSHLVKALIAWVHRGTQSEIRIAEFSTETGNVISGPFSLPKAPREPVGADCRTAAGQPQFDPILQRIVGVRGFYSPGGDRFGVIDCGKALIRDDKRDAWVELPGDNITRFAFNNERDPVIAVTEGATTQRSAGSSGVSNNQLERLSFIRKKKDSWHQDYPSGNAAVGLPPQARLFFFDDQNVMAFVDGIGWSLVPSASSTSSSSRASESVDVFPVGRKKDDGGQDITVWIDRDGVMGYTLASVKNAATSYLSMMGSDPHALPTNVARRMTVASLASFAGQRPRILTIDDNGRVVRVWEVPSSEAVDSSLRYARKAASPEPISPAGPVPAPNQALPKVTFSGNRIEVAGPENWAKTLPFAPGEESKAEWAATPNPQGSIVILSVAEGDGENRSEKVLLIPKDGDVEMAEEGSAEFSPDFKYAAIACVQWVKVLGPKPWKVDLPKDFVGDQTTITRVAVSATGGRTLVWVGRNVLTVDRDGAKMIPTNGGITDAVFGPGDDRVSLVSPTHLIIWKRDGSFERHECLGAHIVRSADEKKVVLYSRAWLHYLTDDGGYLKISSVFKDFPLAPAQSVNPQPSDQIRPVTIDQTNELDVPVSGRRISTLDGGFEPSGKFSVLSWFRSVRINFCDSKTTDAAEGQMSQSDAQLNNADPKSWPEWTCTFAKRINRHVGDSWPQ